MSRSHRCFELVITLLTLLAPCRIFAVSCTTQAQMTEADRATLVQIGADPCVRGAERKQSRLCRR